MLQIVNPVSKEDVLENTVERDALQTKAIPQGNGIYSLEGIKRIMDSKDIGVNGYRIRIWISRITDYRKLRSD